MRKKKTIFKIVLSLLGISAIGYVIAREKVLLRKVAHDCDKIVH